MTMSMEHGDELAMFSHPAAEQDIITVQPTKDQRELYPSPASQ